jgi:hypothetical protein
MRPGEVTATAAKAAVRIGTFLNNMIEVGERGGCNLF